MSGNITAASTGARTTHLGPQRRVGEVRVGDQLPPLVVTVDLPQMFFFSAAVYNGHRIHYDRSWAQDAEGYPDVLVQGHLQSALMSRLVTDWVGGAGRLVRLSLQNRGAVYVEETLTCSGTVTAVHPQDGGGLVDLELQAIDRAGQVVMPGTATVWLPGDAEQGVKA